VEKTERKNRMPVATEKETTKLRRQFSRILNQQGLALKKCFDFLFLFLF